MDEREVFSSDKPAECQGTGVDYYISWIGPSGMTTTPVTQPA